MSDQPAKVENDQPKVIATVQLTLLEGGMVSAGLPQDSILAMGLLQFGIFQAHENLRKAQQAQMRKQAIGEVIRSPFINGMPPHN